MGMCLDPTPEMGGLETEVRSQSVRIYGNHVFFGDGMARISGAYVECDVREAKRFMEESCMSDGR